MKKLIIFLILLVMTPQLTGCGTLSSNHRDVEKLLVMETLGLDEQSGGIRVSLASAANSGKDSEKTPPVRLSGSGASISAAIERMHAYTTGKELFCAHTTHIIIGEDSAREGIEAYLDYICRSPDMRLGIPVFIVKGASAEEAIQYAGDDEQGITELLRSAQDNMDGRGGGHVFPAGEILRDMYRCGGALVAAVECVPKEEGKALKDGCAVEVNGYAVFGDWKLCSFIPKSSAIGVDFLKNKVEVCDLTVDSLSDGSVTMELNAGSSKIRPVWGQDGTLTGLDVYATAEASALELSGEARELDNQQLTALLEETVSGQISAVLLLSRQSGIDFLGLAEHVEAADPYKYSKLESSFTQLLPTLSIQVTVTGKLSHTNDIKGK